MSAKINHYKIYQLNEDGKRIKNGDYKMTLCTFCKSDYIDDDYSDLKLHATGDIGCECEECDRINA